MMPILLRNILYQLVVAPPLPLRVVVLLLAVLAYGTTGFVYFELPQNPDLTWGDGLWYTIVTIATVGYGDLFPKTAAGRFLIGVPLMVFGVGLLAYILSTLAMALVSAKSKEVKGMGAVKTKGHLLIFNYPGDEATLRVLDELAHDGATRTFSGVVLVDSGLEELPASLLARGVHYVRGDPTRDETLSRAAIDDAAHAIILARTPGDTASDHLNLSIAIAVIARNSRINTVVECVEPSFAELLRKAGCDRVVCASRFQGYLVAQELMNPGVQEVVHDLVSMGGQQIYLTAITATSDRRFADLEEACRKRGHLALGLRRGNALQLNPAAASPVNDGDVAVSLGATSLDALTI